MPHDHGHYERDPAPAPERPKSVFGRVAAVINKYKKPVVFGGTALLATTALATPLLTTTVGAAIALAGGLGIMALASDMAIHSTEHLGKKLGVSPLAMGVAPAPV